MDVIRSKGAEFQTIEALKRNRKKRSQLGLVYVEGVQPINAAVANGFAIKTAVIDADRRPSSWAERIVRVAHATQGLSGDLMSVLSEKDEPSELIALVEKPRFDPWRLARDSFVWVVFDRPGSEGNLGSVIRTCNALGVDAVITTGHGVDPYGPASIRASMGAVFDLPVGHLELPGLRALLASVPDASVYGTSAHADRRVTDVVPERSVIVCLGNETNGLSRSISGLCTETLGIEMAGSVSSLNVGAAAAIVLHEIAAARRRAGMARGTQSAKRANAPE